MKKKLIYITYQTFPAFTANSIQTITHLIYFSKINLDVSLIFPLRNKESDADIQKLQEFYNFNENFESIGTAHPLPYKKIKSFEKFMYIISHFLWAYFTVNKHTRNQNNAYFFTRSEWVYYFLSKRQLNVIYECHQLSRIKRVLIKKCIQNQNSKIIFLNPTMLEELSIAKNNRIIVLQSSYDESLFINDNKKPESMRIIYAGSLYRFGESRGLEIFADHLNKINNQNLQLVIAVTDNQSSALIKSIERDNKNINLEIHEKLSRKEIADLYNTCSIGLLLNNDSIHATKFTSPLKFFEYIATGLKVIATNNSSHKLLPYQDSIVYFDLDNTDSVHNAITTSMSTPKPEYSDIYHYSMSHRVKKIIQLFE